MKKVFRQILAYICAVYFLTAGTGFNMIHYCCEGCAVEGIEAVAGRSCEAVHHEQNCGHEDDSCCGHDASCRHEDKACSDTDHQAEGCHLWRMQTDVPSVIDSMSDSSAEFEKMTAFPQMLFALFPENKIQAGHQPDFSPPDDVPLCSGRDILTYHAVLLI